MKTSQALFGEACFSCDMNFPIKYYLPTYLFQITMIIVYEIMNICKSYTWSAEPEELFEGRSSQLYTQLMQLRKESLKKILACTEFEPLTCCDTGAAPSVRVIILSRVYNEPIQRPALSWILTEVVERCTGIVEVKGSNPVQAWIFFRFSFHNCISCVYNCDDLPSNDYCICQ